MKTTKKKEEEQVEMPQLVAQRRMAESGAVYLKGDTILQELVPHDRIVFLLTKEWILPVGGWQELPEPLFTEVMEARD